MAFKYFLNATNIDAAPNQLPNDMYRDLEQEFISQQWDNTSAMFVIQEQSGIGISEYNDIEAWVTPTVADTSTGLKDTNDFLKFTFEDITHRIVRGLMYQFNDNYWIVHSYNPYAGLAQYCGVRRCNNSLKMIDPENGSIFSIPCVVDYDMASPSQQTSRYIITPNNHANIICQANVDTLRLFKTNTRFILSGRPFKLLSYQNALGVTESENTTIFYLDLYLDEIHSDDDLDNGIADNGDWIYSIKINSTNIQAVSGFSGQLTADVTLNGIEVDRDIVWTTSDTEVVTLNENNYTIVGNIGDTAIISATLEGNEAVVDNITVVVVDESDFTPTLYISPVFDQIRQYETIEFALAVEYGGKVYTTFDNVEVTVSDNSLVNLVKNDNGAIVGIAIAGITVVGSPTYSITSLQTSQEPIQINVSVVKENPSFNITESFDIDLVSMFG